MNPATLVRRVFQARQVSVSRGDWNAKPETVPDEIVEERRELDAAIGTWSAPVDGAEVHRREPV